MFNGIKSFFRKVGVMMGIIKELEKVTDHKKIPLSDEFYQKIQQWQDLYRGYHKNMHRITYHTISGQKERDMASLGMARVASNELASLIFNERCEISISDEQYNEFIQDVFKKNAFNGNFQQYLEMMFALGGLAIKPYMKNNKIMLSYVTADCFLPLAWDNARITEGAFLNVINKDNKVYTHIEWHVYENGQYVIKNELFESSNAATLGQKVSLNTLFTELESVVYVDKAIQRPLFAYIKPNLANNIDPNNPLGVSIFANSYDTLQTIDIMFDSLQREFRLGRKRIIVPESAIKTVVDPVTGAVKRYFDATDETYEAMNTGNMDDSKVQDIKVELRVTEHIDAINVVLNIYAMQLGFSSGTFTFDGKSMKTATEVISEQSKTFKTKQSHENVIEQGITDLIECIGIVAEGYNLVKMPDDYDVTVTFDDSIAQDRTADIKEQILLVGARLQSRLKAIMKLHGLTEDEAKVLIDEINAEEKLGMPERREIENSLLYAGLEE